MKKTKQIHEENKTDTCRKQFRYMKKTNQIYEENNSDI